MSWSFQKIWNESLEKPDLRTYEPRDYLWASELGKIETDVWLRMRGEEPTNPPNNRSLRKFEAGNLWESIVEIILIRAGIMQGTQDRVKFGYEGLLEVSGKIDFIAGGVVDPEKAKAELSGLHLPEKTLMAIGNIVDYLAETYPDGLEKKALEVKSVSSFMMNAIEATERPLAIHRLQAYHYTKHPEIERTDIVYLCREDCRMFECPVIANTPAIEAEYRGWIETYTKNYHSDEMPEKGKPIVFDEDMGKFSINRQIGWSPYLTKVYGYESQMEFENKYGKIPASWNRTLKRLKNGDKITDRNKEVFEEMREAGFEPDVLVTMMVDTPDETEDN